MNRLLLPMILFVAALITACSDDTAGIGFDIMPDNDKVSSMAATYPITSSTLRQEAVVARSGACYLGSVIDPELKVKTTCDFLGQFHLPDNFALPLEEKMVKDESDGLAFADSIDVRLYYDTYYGDSLAPMKLTVLPLSRERVLEETENYYTNINPMEYVDNLSPYKASVSYSAKDLTRPSNETDGTAYYRQVVVKLPAALGTEIIRKYYADNGDGFQNSYHFVHKVFPGFYFRHAGGLGTMITAKMMSMNLYFRYHSETAAGNDTIVDGFLRFGGTPEVIQTTRVDNNIPDDLLPETGVDVECTYLKTPTGMFTELTLPVSEICRGNVAGETHYNDSIASVSLNLRKYNDVVDSKYSLPAPTYLLMVRKAQKDEFFEKRSLPNNKDSYLSAAFTPSSYAYQFANISQLITNLRNERDKEAGVVPGMSDAEREARYTAWESKPENAEWNKVVLVPVDAAFTSAPTGYGSTAGVLHRVTHYLGLSSAKIEGGKDKLKLHVVYTRKR